MVSHAALDGALLFLIANFTCCYPDDKLAGTPLTLMCSVRKLGSCVDSGLKSLALGAADTRPVGTSRVPKDGDRGFSDAPQKFRGQFSLLGVIPFSPV